MTPGQWDEMKTALAMEGSQPQAVLQVHKDTTEEYKVGLSNKNGTSSTYGLVLFAPGEVVNCIGLAAVVKSKPL